MDKVTFVNVSSKLREYWGNLTNRQVKEQGLGFQEYPKYEQADILFLGEYYYESFIQECNNGKFWVAPLSTTGEAFDVTRAVDNLKESFDGVPQAKAPKSFWGCYKDTIEECFAEVERWSTLDPEKWPKEYNLPIQV